MLIIERGNNDGIRIEVQPSDKPTYFDIQTIGFKESRSGRPLVRLGFLAPESVWIDRHEKLYQEEILTVPLDLLKPGDVEKLKVIAASLPTRSTTSEK